MRTDIVKSALLRDALRSAGPQPVDAAAPGRGSEWHELALVVSAEAAVLENARALIDLLRGRLAELEHEALEQLIETAYPLIAGRPAPATLDQARRNAEIRAAFERDHEMLTAEQVHVLCGSSAGNRAALGPCSWIEARACPSPTRRRRRRGLTSCTDSAAEPVEMLRVRPPPHRTSRVTESGYAHAVAMLRVRPPPIAPGIRASELAPLRSAVHSRNLPEPTAARFASH